MFIVDLRGYLPPTEEVTPLLSRAQKIADGPGKLGRPIQRRHVNVIQDLAPSVKSWTEGRTLRPVREELTKLKWLFYFLDDMYEVHPDLPSDPKVADLGAIIGVDFAEWLRCQPEIGSRRMDAIYCTVASALARHARRKVWSPSPFSSHNSDVNSEELHFTKPQFTALLRMAKSMVSEFMNERRRNRKIYREIDRADPARRVAYQAPTPLRSKFRLRNAIAHAREDLLNGRKPNVNSGWPGTCMVPTGDLVGALFLLCMLRTGANEQPLLDIAPGSGLKPGPWLHVNPFGPEHRTILLWKNRSGQDRPNQKTRIALALNAKPTFYPVKLLRYQELLGGWCRAAICAAERCGRASKSFLRAAERAKGSFWIYWEGGKWRSLKGSRTHSVINGLIEKNAHKWPDLLDPDGKPIRYSARAIRDAYLEFVVHQSGFSVVTGQQELSHSRDSNSIKGYLGKKWARTYAHNALREFQSASAAVLQTSGALSGVAIKRRLRGEDESAPEQPGLTKVRSGLWCVDPSSPPEHLHVLRGAGEQCPAQHCFDCYHARSFASSLPETARDVMNLRARRDQVSAYIWNGSSADIQLRMLEDILGRYPEPAVVEAFRKAEWLDTPILEYRPSL